MLDRVADLAEDFDSVTDGKAMLVTELRDRDALDILHDEVRAALRCGAAVKDACDAWMIHQGQRLPFSLETRDHGLGVHPQLDDLYRNAPPNRLELVSEIDGSEPTFADQGAERIAVDGGSDQIVRPWSKGRDVVIIVIIRILEQRQHTLFELLVIPAGLLDIGIAVGSGQVYRRLKNVLGVTRSVSHRLITRFDHHRCPIGVATKPWRKPTSS